MPTPTDADRLRALAGHRCPVCIKLSPSRPPETLYADGRRLCCGRGHGYSNPDAAESEILKDREILSAVTQ